MSISPFWGLVLTLALLFSTAMDFEAKVGWQTQDCRLGNRTKLCVYSQHDLFPMLNTFTVKNLYAKKFTTSMHWSKHASGFRSEVMLERPLGKRQGRAVCSSLDPFWFSNASWVTTAVTVPIACSDSSAACSWLHYLPMSITDLSRFINKWQPFLSTETMKNYPNN